eukprot:6479364-Amphidinium_carterae.1
MRWEQVRLAVVESQRELLVTQSVDPGCAGQTYALFLRALQATWRGDYACLDQLLGRCKHWGIQRAGMTRAQLLTLIGDRCTEAYISYMTEMAKETSEVETQERAHGSQRWMTAILQAWKRRKFVTSTPGVRQADGIAMDEETEIGLLRDHWAKKFSHARRVCERDAVRMLSYIPRGRLPDIDFSEMEVRSLIRGLPMSAAGPDNVSYRMIKGAIDVLAPVIADAGNAWQAGARLPESWLSSHLIWIPKEEANALSVDQFRPLSLEQSCYKLLCRMMAAAWMPHLSALVSPHQHAYIRDRGLTTALWEIEFGALFAARAHEQALLLALDIDSAFPSVNRQWIKMVLRHVGLTDNQVRMLWPMFELREVPFIWRGRKVKGVSMSNGVAQGNPMSAWLFSIAFDAFIRMVAAQMRYKEVAVGFADDVTLVLDSLDRLHDVLEWARIMNGAMSLGLKLGKTKLIPLGGYGLEDWKSAVEDMHPDWGSNCVVSMARILGIIFGHGRDLVMDAVPVNRVIERWDFLLDSRLGLAKNNIMARMLMYSCLNHLTSHTTASTPLRRLWKELHSTFTAGPTGWQKGWGDRSMEICKWRSAIENMECFSLAAQVSALLRLPRDPVQAHDQLLLTGYGWHLEDGVGHLELGGWETQGLLSTLAHAARRAVELGILRRSRHSRCGYKRLNEDSRLSLAVRDAILPSPQ